MKRLPKYNIGDSIKYKDGYWGLMTGTIVMIGYQGNKVVYGLQLENGGTTTCKENEIKQKLNN